MFRLVIGNRSPVACRLSPVTCHRSQSALRSNTRRRVGLRMQIPDLYFCSDLMEGRIILKSATGYHYAF